MNNVYVYIYVYDQCIYVYSIYHKPVYYIYTNIFNITKITSLPFQYLFPTIFQFVVPCLSLITKWVLSSLHLQNIVFSPLSSLYVHAVNILHSFLTEGARSFELVSWVSPFSWKMGKHVQEFFAIIFKHICMDRIQFSDSTTYAYSFQSIIFSVNDITKVDIP